MPPKSTTAISAKEATAREKAVSDLGEFFKNQKPPLSADEYESLIPRHTEGPY